MRRLCTPQDWRPMVSLLLPLLLLLGGQSVRSGDRLPYAAYSLTSSFLGGSGPESWPIDEAFDIVELQDGSILVAGTTRSLDFPVTAGGYECATCGAQDVFVAVMSSDLSDLIASITIGGTADEERPSLTVLPDGRICLGLLSYSSDYPTSAGVFSTTRNGTCDLALTVFEPDLSSIVASTYFGGPGCERISGISCDDDGGIYIAGLSSGAGIPTSPQSFQQAYGGGVSDFFVCELNMSLDELVASTYVGGRYADDLVDLALSPDGTVVLAGRSESDNYPVTDGAYDETYGTSPAAPGQDLHDVVVTRLSNDLTSVIASTYVGGELYDGAQQIVINAAGNICVAGHTSSVGYPSTAGTFDDVHNGQNEWFITVLDSSLSSVLASTYLTPDLTGTEGFVFGTGLTVGPQGDIIQVGVAWDDLVFTTPTAYDTAFHGGVVDLFVFQLSEHLSSATYSSYFGGTGGDYDAVACVGADSSVLVIGITDSPDFPTTEGVFDRDLEAGSTDCLIMRLDPVQVDCCGAYTGGYTGNANCSEDGKLTLSDITRLIDRVYISKTRLCCESNGNTNGSLDAQITLSDITHLIDNIYISRKQTAECL